MPSNVAPAQDGNEIAPPPNPSQGHQGSDPGEPAIATTPFTIKEAKQARLSGRGFRRLVSLCRTVTQLVAEYDRHLLASGPDADSDIDNDNDNEDHSPERREEIRRRRDRNYQSFLQLVKLIPQLKDKITNPCEESRMLYYGQMLGGANSARCDDVSRVMSEVANFLNNRSENPVKPPLSPSTRENRGLQNDFTGRLLCPIKYNWDDPVIRAKIRDGVDDHNAFDDYWIRCLYEGEQGDPEDVEKGFLKSRLLVKTFQSIFTSPSSARGDLDAAESVRLEPQGRRRRVPSKRPSVAVLLKMDGRVTVRAIAYTAVQLHFALNDASNWTIHYNGFNYEEFYEFVVDFLEEDQTPEGKAASSELLNWWNQHVFPRSAATREASSSSARRKSFAVLHQQRRTRRQAV